MTYIRPYDTARTGLASICTGAAYGLGYVFTYALSIASIRDSSIAQLAETFGDDGAAWKMVGWAFYNAHGATATLDVAVPSSVERRR